MGPVDPSEHAGGRGVQRRDHDVRGLSASRTSVRESSVALVRTATGMSVIFLMPRMSPPIDRLRVGSPEPEKVM